MDEDPYETYPPMFLPCGGVARFDDGSGCSHRCEECLATVGSIGMPSRCRDEMKKWDAWVSIGGKGWDYERGEPK